MTSQLLNINSPIKITVSALIQAPIAKVWACWNEPPHIVHWNHASDDWHCPFSINDLSIGGKFVATLAAKDDSIRFDFEGFYDVIELHKQIIYHMADGRVVEITFEAKDSGTWITETFDVENENPVELQQAGWQTIFNNFKKYAEEHELA